ncbi:MAG: hypothetical protein KKD77_23925, partial [Gammaproteobacteria bacterium]|nr:hypothetical protein [Gammaproteobacteria bacterium]
MISSNQAFAYIKSISKVSGNTKQVYLRSFMGLEPYLLAAYDPYKKYYITKGKPGKGEKEFDN